MNYKHLKIEKKFLFFQETAKKANTIILVIMSKSINISKVSKRNEEICSIQGTFFWSSYFSLKIANIEWEMNMMFGKIAFWQSQLDLKFPNNRTDKIKEQSKHYASNTPLNKRVESPRNSCCAFQSSQNTQRSDFTEKHLVVWSQNPHKIFLNLLSFVPPF
jgi:hypothetical protein